MYTQRDEERFILEFFGGFVGRFLDIGAYDYIDSSNTARLREAGWSGVMVEPAPNYFRNLLNQLASNPTITLVNCALGDEDGFGTFHYTELGGTSTFDAQFYANWKDQNMQYRDYVAPIIGVSRFLNRFPGPYDFIDIDAEGMDVAILGAMPVGLCDARMVCIECSDPQKIGDRMSSEGFRLLHRTTENLIWVRP